MEDLSLKSLAVTGMLIGGGFWALGRSQAIGNAERSPTASSQAKRSFKINTQETYRPSISEFSQERPVEEQNVRVDPATTGTEPVAQANAATVDFANTRSEITKNLAHGDIDNALDIAERKLEEVINSSSTDMAYIGYLHEFVMQNAEDAETELSVTVSALRSSQDPNVRKFIYDKFNTYAPELVERLDGELDSIGASIE